MEKEYYKNAKVRQSLFYKKQQYKLDKIQTKRIAEIKAFVKRKPTKAQETAYKKKMKNDFERINKKLQTENKKFNNQEKAKSQAFLKKVKRRLRK